MSSEEVHCRSSEVKGGFADSYQESKRNVDGSMIGDEPARVNEDEQQSLKYNATYVDCKINSPTLENCGSGVDSRYLGEAADDEIVFTPRTTNKYRAKAVIASDNESDDKPLIDRRKSVSRRRSQMIYPSSSDDDDDDDDSGHQQPYEVESEVNNEESAKDFEISGL